MINWIFTQLREKSEIGKNQLKQTDSFNMIFEGIFLMYTIPFYFNTVQHYSEVKNFYQKFIEVYI